ISVPFANKQVTEITCHGKGAHFLFPAARTVIDIGGQDSKVIRLSDLGSVVDFAMNEKCAAGTGRFLEVMAQALEVKLEDMAQIARKALRSVSISSMCTVFAESEVVSLIAEGTPREEIIRGLHQAVADRTSGLVHRVGLEKQVVMTGGVAKNAGAVHCLEEKLKVKIVVPEEPQITGALGAALVACDAVNG
ncbi:MAG TPA: 2-hydroxyglutaryl-CoA dehydratase, partial [Firmicutes bacterium]|nr:2-hydroxyglutaryl-CoA dehydratase [Bacillota bacterium]